MGRQVSACRATFHSFSQNLAQAKPPRLAEQGEGHAVDEARDPQAFAQTGVHRRAKFPGAGASLG